MICEIRWSGTLKEEPMKIVHFNYGGNLVPCVLNYVVVSENSKLVMSYDICEQLKPKQAIKCIAITKKKKIKKSG